MITLNVPQDKKITQKSYDEILDGLGFHRLFCPCCGRAGGLTRHGRYGRGIKIKGELIKLRIVRVKCENCGKTHALLPSYIVPYTRILLEEQLEIVRQSEGERNYTAVMNANALIDESNVRSVIRRYRRSWKERLISFGLSIREEAEALVKSCFRYFRRQFLQIRGSPNGLFS